jgi:hypothetical protein
MFESHEALAGQIHDIVSSLRRLGDGRYACVLDPSGVLFDDRGEDASPQWGLRRFLEQHTGEVFAIPARIRSDSPADDVFAGWEEDAFFLAFVNGRVAVVVACPDPAALEARAGPLLKALVDRLIRYNPAWRADERGRGFFFSRPRLDTVVVAPPSE